MHNALSQNAYESHWIKDSRVVLSRFLYLSSGVQEQEHETVFSRIVIDGDQVISPARHRKAEVPERRKRSGEAWRD